MFNAGSLNQCLKPITDLRGGLFREPSTKKTINVGTFDLNCGRADHLIIESRKNAAGFEHHIGCPFGLIDAPVQALAPSAMHSHEASGKLVKTPMKGFNIEGVNDGLRTLKI